MSPRRRTALASAHPEAASGLRWPSLAALSGAMHLTVVGCSLGSREGAMPTPPLWVSSGQDPAWREVTGQSSDGSKETSWKSLGGGGARVGKQLPEPQSSRSGFAASAAETELHP